MTARQFLIAWGGALAIIATIMAALAWLSEDLQRFQGEPVAVVGSSIVAYAFPQTGGGTRSLLGDGRSHRRIGITAISEFETIRLARLALGAGANTVFLEIDPFVRTNPTRYAANPCAGPTQAFRFHVQAAKRRLARAARVVVGHGVSEGWYNEPNDLDRPQAVDVERARRTYAGALHEPFCGRQLAELVRSARAAHAQIVFVHLPRSNYATEIIGQYRTGELRLRTERLAVRLGVPLFSPREPWPNSEFMDHGHLNRKGRARLMAELGAWWRARP